MRVLCPLVLLTLAGFAWIVVLVLENNRNVVLTDHGRTASSVPSNLQIQRPQHVREARYEERIDSQAPTLKFAETGAYILEEYLFLLETGEETPENGTQLKKLMDDIAVLLDKREARDLLLRLVHNHGTSVFHQELSVHASELHLSFCENDSSMYEESRELLSRERNPRSLFVLSQACKQGYQAGVLDSVTEDLYAAYQQADDVLLTVQLVGSLTNTGNTSLALAAFEEELYKQVEYDDHFALSTGPRLAFMGYENLLTYENGCKARGIETEDSRNEVARAVMDFASTEHVEHLQWRRAWTLLSRFTPEYRQVLLESAKAVDSRVRQDIEYRKALFEANKKKPKDEF